MDICVLPLMMWLAYAIRLARPNVQVMQGLDAWYIYVGDVWHSDFLVCSVFIVQLYVHLMKTICYGFNRNIYSKSWPYIRLKN